MASSIGASTPAWRAAALAYRAARRESKSHHQAQNAAHMAISAHHPALSKEEASDESVKAIAYASTFHAEWFWRGVAARADAVVLRQKQLHDQVQEQAADLARWNKTLEQRVSDQLAEIERISRLKRFLAPQVVDLILSSGDDAMLESHRGDITVVFCDLRGFTAFAEVAEPEEVMTVLREYHASLGELIHRHEGTLDHFAGDGFMVLFNDPLPCPDPALRAVKMAVEMRDVVAGLSVKWRRYGPELGFGIGIARGYATLGRIGFEGRFDYSAIGTVVNLAARLCAEAKAGQILVDSKVHSAVEDQADMEATGELTLKGMLRPLGAWNIRALRVPKS
jgi:class 3 adenylate cyclase